jgi:peroxiredoxin
MHILNAMNCEVVYLVNGGRPEHREFRDTFKIRPQILIDEDGAIGEAYGVYGVNARDLDKNYLAPAVYLIDAEGNVSCFWLLSGPRGRPSPECILGVLSLAQQNDWKY